MQPVAPVPVAKSNDRESAVVTADDGGDVQLALVGQLSKLVGLHPLSD